MARKLLAALIALASMVALIALFESIGLADGWAIVLGVGIPGVLMARGFDYVVADRVLAGRRSQRPSA